MANRSKKAVISARIDPLLKAGLEMAATSQREKIVALLEYGISGVLTSTAIADPFSGEKGTQTAHLLLMQKVWSDDEVVYKLRIGSLGFLYADKETVDIATLVTTDEYFKGDFDLFGDLNGLLDPEIDQTVPKMLLDLDRVKAEWDFVFGYVQFVYRNRGLKSNYHDFKTMVNNSR